MNIARKGHATRFPAFAAILAVSWCFSSVALAQEIAPTGATGATSALVIKRNTTQAELDEIARVLSRSAGKAQSLEKSISDIEKTKTGMRSAMVESARRRKAFERKILDTEKNLHQLQSREITAKTSLLARRDVLAEVLAALQRMGRNPPPAMLVRPDDALSSVRSAILLGAVVPGMRKETDRLAADLQKLSDLHRDILTEKENYVATMASLFGEEQRMDQLIAQNDLLSDENAKELIEERARAAELAAKATSLEGLIASLERDISADGDRLEALRLERLSPDEREKRQALADSTVPDENRIAPAFPFSQLKARLELPVTGSLLRKFNEADGTGHAAQGLTLAANGGSIVTAPADGWIVFSGPFRSYGDMVIVNMGDGYHLLLTGMGGASVRPGQFVVAGEPLGRMGEKRVASATALALETERPTLYIELRKDGKPIDSKSWWSLKDFGKARNDT